MKMGNNGRFYKIIKATALVIGLALVIVIQMCIRDSPNIMQRAPP